MCTSSLVKIVFCPLEYDFSFRLPSISAAVSTYAPEMYIWRIFIGIHGGPRLVLAFANKFVLNFLFTQYFDAAATQSVK